MLCVCQQLASTVQNVEYGQSSIVSYVGYRFITACSYMRCSVVFGVTQRLIVINISLFCLAKHRRSINTSDVSQLAVYTGHVPLATLLTTPQHTWLVAALTAGTKARYRLRIAISVYPTWIRRPRQGGFCRNIATPFVTEKLEWCGYPMVKCLFVLT